MSVWLIYLACTHVTVISGQCRYVGVGGSLYPIDKCAMSVSYDSNHMSMSAKFTCSNDGVQQITYDQAHCTGISTVHNLTTIDSNYNCYGSSSTCQLVDFDSDCVVNDGMSTSQTLVAEICTTGGLKLSCTGRPTSCYNNVTTTTPAPSFFDVTGCYVEISHCYYGSSGPSTGETIANASSDSSMIMIIGVVSGAVILLFIVCILCYCKKKNYAHTQMHNYESPATQTTQTTVFRAKLAANIENAASGTTVGGDDELPSYDAVAMVPSAPGQPVEDAALPYGWSKAVASDGRTYYLNDVTKHTQWEKPVGGRQDSTIILPHGWRKANASDGRTYYLNDITKQTQWTVPTQPVGLGNQPGAIGNTYTDTPGLTRMETSGQEGGGGVASAPFMGDGKYSDVQYFFYNEVCIEDYNDRYISLMIENGFDNLDIIKTLTMQDLIDIGVDKLGHRKKIINELGKL